MRELLLKVKDLKDIISTAEPPPPRQLYNLWSIFKYEEIIEGCKFWRLYDETCHEGINVRVSCIFSPNCQPQSGDIVRIHRLNFDSKYKTFAVTHQRNVIYWKSFTYQPKPVTEAQRPTLTSNDSETQRTLENYYCNQLVPLNEIHKLGEEQANFVNCAGSVQATHLDRYGHYRVIMEDGTQEQSTTVRIFKKDYPKDTSLHYDMALTLERGDYIVVVGGKYDPRTCFINLSTNTFHGRGIRKVEKLSMLGVQLTTRLSSRPEEPPTAGFIGSILETSSFPRRSPRLRSSTPSSQELIHSQPSQSFSSSSRSSAQPVITSPSNSQSTAVTPPPNLLPSEPPEPSPPSRLPSFIPSPKSHQPSRWLLNNNYALVGYTRLDEISRISDGAYQFFNIFGQVRGSPNITSTFNNLVFQITDGSKLNYQCFFEREVTDPVPNCVTIYVYSQQKPQDSNVHIRVAEKLREGDLVSIINIRGSWKNDKLKLEMNPYTLHGKSINVIDKESQLGIRLLEVVSNPIVEELEEVNQGTVEDDSIISVQ